jgi:ankyrin repeat protein
MNLEQLRKQAKELVRAARAGDADALARLGGEEPMLARAQLVLAREHGYPSWPALVAAVEANAEGFVRAATSGRRARAEAMLAARPEIARDPWVRLVRGEGWEGDASEPGGPRGWAPLLYVCHSVFASTDLARSLLARGADPNATFTNEYGEMSAVYGASGVVHDPELTRVLLEAGANPDDGESVYHATEARSPECLRVLLEHGATAEPIMLAHALDSDGRTEHVRLLLDAGADARGLLPHAVRRGRGPQTVRLLVGHGAELERRGGEGWRRPERVRTAYQHAVLRGRDEVAATLAELGANTAVDPDDFAIAAIARGERPPEVPDALDYDQQEVIVLAALGQRMPLVVELFGPDLRGVVGGSPEGSLLHHVAWVGNPELARFLLDAGAEVGDALDWAASGSQHHGIPGRDYAGVASQLVDVGAVTEPRHLEQADGPLAEWLEARLQP